MKKLFVTFLFAGILSFIPSSLHPLFSSSLSAQIPSDGLVAWYPFNGNANDESGNENHGVVNGAMVISDRNGNTGSAFGFNGANQFITVPHSDQFNFVNEYSISLWFTVTDYTSHHTIINKNNTGCGCNDPFNIETLYSGYYHPAVISVFEVNVGEGALLAQWGDGSSSEGLFYNSAPSVGDWHNVIITVGNSSKMYLDGVLVQEYTKTLNLIQNQLPISIGAWQGTGIFHSGNIDDIAIYDRSLTNVEIQQLYQDQTGQLQQNTTCLPAYVPTDGLVGYWPFCGNANDESGNGNNGTVSGATLTADRNGNANSAYSFNGLDTKIIVPNSSSIEIGTSNYTLSAWVNTSSINETNGRIVSKGSSQCVTGYMMRTGWPNSSKILVESAYNGSCFFQNGSIGTTNDGQWHLVTAVVDRSTGVKLFIDGALDSETNIGSLADLSNGQDLFFGYNNLDNVYEPFLGELDDIGIWNRALSSQEVQTLYLSGQAPCTPVSNSISATIVQGQSYTLGTQNLTTAGTYTEVFTSAAGCDSTVTLTLSVEPLLTCNITTPSSVLCAGDNVVLGLAPINGVFYQSGLGNYQEFNGHYYLKYSGLANWYEAKSIAEQMGGHLAIPNTIEESNFIVALSETDQSAQPYFWLGISDEIQEGTWIDVLGNQITFSNWAVGEPNNENDEDFGLVYSLSVGNGHWNDGHYFHNLPFVIEFEGIVASVNWSTNETTPTITVSPTINTTYTCTVTQGNSTCTASVDITVNPAITNAVSATIVEGQSYTLGTQTLTTAGTYTEVFTSAAGCDSTVTLTLAVEPLLTCSIEASQIEICVGQSVVLNNINSQSTVQDSILIDAFTMTVNSYFSHYTPILENGKTYRIRVNGRYGFADGWQHNDAAWNYAWDLATQTKVWCNGTQDAWPDVRWLLNGQTDFARPDNDISNNGNFCSGIDKIYFWTVNGANSPYHFEWVDGAYGDNSGSLTFEIYELVNNSSFNSSIVWSNNETTPTITVSPTTNTTYSCTVTSGTQTCTANVEITVNPAITNAVSATIVEGQSYSLGTQTLTTAGTFTEVFTSAAGCDSTVTFTLAVEPLLTCEITAPATTLCEGDLEFLTLGTSYDVDSIQGMNYLGELGSSRYYMSELPNSWSNAKIISEQLGGHLVTIGDIQENQFILSKIGLKYVYIGLYQDLLSADYSEPSGGWKWVTEESLDFTNWSPAEPNNGLTGNENVAHMYSSGGWNDLTGTCITNCADGQSMYFIVEIPNSMQSSLTWSTNETTPTITVSPTQTTTYTATVTTATQTCTDSITITVNPLLTWYADNDGDGFGDAGNIQSACDQPQGFVSNSNDCNDNEILAFVGAVDVCDNGIDEDCSGADSTCFILGCTDVTACNFNPTANTDDNSCTYPVQSYLNCEGACINDTDGDGICDEVEIPGCTDMTAFNYNAQATNDDGSCVPVIEGCTDPTAFNYDANANVDVGSCIPVVLGCTNQMACNYNDLANTDDNSCILPQTETCNGLDDDCDGQVDEGLTIAAVNATSVTTALYPTCSGNALKSANLNNGTNSDLIEGNGLDLWYSLTAQYNTLRASLSAAFGDNEIRLYQVNNGCFQLIQTEHEVYTTTSLGTGNQVLISDDLIPGQTYYIAVHNISGSMNPSAKMCFNHFVGTTCDHYYSNNTGIYNNVCTSFKAQYKGNATNYIFDVLSATQNNANLNITPWSYTTTTANSVVPRLGTIFPVNMSASAKVYTLRIPVIYAIPDAAGNYTSITANATTTCTVTLNPELPVALRAVDRCPNTKSTTSSISIDRTICGALRYEWEFTQQIPSVQSPVTVLGGLNTTVFFLNNVPGMGTGKTYNVRVRPIHTNGEVGSWGTAQCLKTGTAGMVMQSENESVLSLTDSPIYRSTDSPFTLFPNPTSTGRFTLTTSNTSDDEVKDITMTNITGKVVYKTQVVLNGNAVEIEFGNLASGVYVVMVGEERMRLVVE